MNFTPPQARLDRLSALIKSVAPRVAFKEASVTVAKETGSGHCVYVSLMTKGAQDFVCASSKPVAGACMQVWLDGPAAPLLMREFRLPMVLSLDAADVALIHAVELVRSELSSPRCGQPAMLASVGEVLFIGLLRHLVAHPHYASGLFAGLADPQIAAALVAMHERPQAAWALESLAEQVGVSRTAFATRFKKALNTSPGKYLTHLRLQIAQRAVDAGKGLKGAARESGYRDVSALSRALGRLRDAQQSENATAT